MASFSPPWHHLLPLQQSQTAIKIVIFFSRSSCFFGWFTCRTTRVRPSTKHKNKNNLAINVLFSCIFFAVNQFLNKQISQETPTLDAKLHCRICKDVLFFYSCNNKKLSPYLLLGLFPSNQSYSIIKFPVSKKREKMWKTKTPQRLVFIFRHP